MKNTKFLILLLIISFLGACQNTRETKTETTQNTEMVTIADKINEYAEVKLTADLAGLSPKEQQIISLLIDAAKIADEIFWQQAFGDRKAVLDTILDDKVRTFFEINYGPWERLNGNKPFVKGFGEKPAGANFYPADMSKEDFENLKDPEKLSLYTLIKRDKEGKLYVEPYHKAYKEQVDQIVTLLNQAAGLAENPSLKKYLTLRAKAIQTDNYFESDMAWMDLKDNNIDFVLGPIETYDDALYGYKASWESYILVKDKEWSNKLARFAKLMPQLQKALPVDEKYKKEVPGSSSEISVYDAVYYAGDCNSGSKTIAINLPNDKKVNELKGSRKLQLKNSMKYKFDKIMVPIANILIAEDQRKNISFDAFFENVMFHEVGHALGISKTITSGKLVTQALSDQYSALEEGKADIMGLYIVTKLYEMGELKKADLLDNYVTFMAGIFRSVRFGASSAHGKANMVRFYEFEEVGAFTRDEKTGTYRVNFEKMKEAMNNLTRKIITIQGDGNYEAAKNLITDKGFIRDELKSDLERIAQAGIPKDVIFQQGKMVLGLK
jgi:hypothetical protein